LVIEAYLDGAGPYPMVFDLGADAHELDPEVARFLLARRAGEEAELPDAFEARLAIGGVPAGAHGFALRSMQPLLQALGRRIAGKLGGQALAGALTLDFAAGRAIFDPEAGQPVDPYTLAPAELEGAALAVAANYGGEPLALAIDTTLAAMLALPADQAQLPADAPRLALGGAARSSWRKQRFRRLF
jgi:hypothetical protein